MNMRFLISLILVIAFTGFNFTLNAQTGQSVADAIPVDFTSSNTVTFNNVSSQNSPHHATGMQGACSAINCCSTIVYKVTTHQEGALYAYSNNFVAQSMGMIAYSGATTASTNSDLTYYTNGGTNIAGNQCGFRDTLFIGRGYKRWSNPVHWSDKATWNPVNGEYSLPAGTYYVQFWNYNQERSTGGASDLTFEFIPSCVVDQPEIEVEGNSVNIAIGDDTPSTTDNTDFGTMITGAAPVSKTFTIKNVSVNDLDINNTTITGDQAANFSITASPAATVLGNSNTTFTVEFTPNTVGENNATVVITNTDCDRASFRFDLRAFVLGTSPSSVRGNMITLDGSNDYVEINSVASHFDGLDDFSFEAWVYVDGGFTGKGRIMAINDGDNGNGSGNFLFTVNNGGLETFDGNNTRSYGSADLKGAWHHVAVTHDNSDFWVYLNGKLQDTKSASLSQLTSSKRWSLGQEFDSGNSTSDFFQGKMDEVRIWKDVRSQEEIQTNMNLSFTQDQIASLENLVAYYQFDNDDATGTTDGVKDLLGNHGTVKNGGVYSASEVAVGNGVSEKQTVNTTGTYDFSTVGVELMVNGGTVPSGEIIISKITTEDPKNISAGELANNPTTYWVIRNLGTNNSGLNVDVKFKFQDGQIADNLTTNHKIHKRGSNDFDTGDWTDLTPTSVSSAGGDNHITVNVTSFSQFAASSSTSDFTAVVPVELTYFTGHLTTENTTQLNWQTASEINNHGFEIQRATGSGQLDNNLEWENIGFVLGEGNTAETMNYEFIDLQPKAGINYYRLKQVDFDGRFEYSKTLNIEYRILNDELRIFPNPIQNELNIMDGQGLATIYSLLGQSIRTFNIQSSTFKINTANLANGQYILYIQRADGSVATKRFVK